MTHTILAHILSLLTLVVAPAAADEVDAYVAGHHGKRAGLCDRIECTDDQRAQIDAIRDAHRQDAADERAEAKALREALKVERKKAEPNPEEIARLEAALDSVKAELRRDREASKAEIAALLTPEQRAELDAMKAERKAERERHGKDGKGKAHAKRERGPEGKGGKGKAHAKRGPEGKGGKGKAHAKRERGPREALRAG